MSIPKIIWQTHNYEYEDLPIHFKKVAQTWKNLNPDWEYRYVSHNQREEIVKKYPLLWEYYPTQDGVCQADIWRYLVTYEYGGVYADMDSVCTKPLTYELDNLKDSEIFICPPYMGEKSFKEQIGILRSKNFSEENIKFRIQMQINRKGTEVYQSEDGRVIKILTTKSSNYAIKKESQIMKQIIKQCEDHFVKNIIIPGSKIMLYIPFLDVLHGLENDPSVSFNFNAFHHDDIFKTDFYSDFLVDDYGVQMTYDDYLAKHSLPIC